MCYEILKNYVDLEFGRFNDRFVRWRQGDALPARRGVSAAVVHYVPVCYMPLPSLSAAKRVRPVE